MWDVLEIFNKEDIHIYIYIYIYYNKIYRFKTTFNIPAAMLAHTLRCV